MAVEEGKTVVDPSVPKQVQEAATLAEDLHGKMFATEETPSEPETPADPAAPEVPAAEAAPSDTPAVPETPEVIDWEERHNKLEQQHKTLKGKYDAEVPESRSRADRLENEMKDFKKKVITDIEALAPPADGVETTPELTARKERAQKYMEEYGDEYVGDQKAFFIEEILPLLQDHFKPVEEKVSTVAEAQSATAQKEYTAMVDKNIANPDWQDDWVNEGSNLEMEKFLAQPDPSGLFTNGYLAEQYNNTNNGEKFAILMNRFYGEKPAAPADPVTPTAAAPETPAVPKKPAAVAPSPDALIAPSRTAPQTTLPDSGEKTIWTKASMRAFENKDRAGEYTPEESQALWNDLLMAPVEGRVRA